jgi:polyketide biosynthesis enoyl-CoA hydratase PksI
MIAAPLVVSSVAQGVALVQMRDEAGRNALSRELTADLESALREAGGDQRVRVVILAGLPEYFCTGASQAVLEEAIAGSIAPGELLLPRTIFDVPVPVIAAMEGHAIGGGFAIGLCADILVAARESWYACNFMNYGFTPGMGTTALAADLFGPAIAAEMLFTGRRFKGSELERGGGFNHVLPRVVVMAKARDLADRIAEKPAISLRALKAATVAPRRDLFERARVSEIAMHELTFARAETRQRLRDDYGVA